MECPWECGLPSATMDFPQTAEESCLHWLPGHAGLPYHRGVSKGIGRVALS